MSPTLTSQAFPPNADGLVVTYFSDFYSVRKVNGDLIQCKRKALLKKQGLSVVVGDFVTLDETESSMGWITGILPPTMTLSKPKIHNISHVLIASPWQEPQLDLRQVDRLLTKVLLSGLSPLLVFTKADIHPEQPQHGSTLAEWLHYYTHTAGVPTRATSIYNTDSIDGLKATLNNIGGRWVLAGVSGAGKSSLLNAIDPQLKLRVNEVSHKGGRGTHTTRHTELLETLNGLLIADAPGFSQLDFSLDEPISIQNAFPECQVALSPLLEEHASPMAGYARERGRFSNEDMTSTPHPTPPLKGEGARQKDPQQCPYEDCLHVDEQGCVIKNAVDEGHLLKSRYEHYVDLVKEALAGEHLRLAQSQKTESATKQGKSKKSGKAVSVVKLNPELRDANRKENRQALKKLEQHILHQQRLEDGLDYDEDTLNDEDF
jgi:ribosome biogenesis GTPase